MGMGLRFGIGPLRFWIPLNKKRKSKVQVFHGIVRMPSGKSWTCSHNHRTLEAANQCAARFMRQGT